MPRAQDLLLLALGALAATGFAPLELWPLTLACLAGWWWLVYHADSLPSALWRGWLFGLGHFTVNNNWIQHAFTYQDAMPATLGYIAVVALALYLAVYPMLAAGLAWRLASPRSVGDRSTTPGIAFALVAGAAWIASEWLRARMFSGYAWDPLGVIWVPVAGVAYLASWIGTYALSGLTVVAAAALLPLAQGRWQGPAVVWALGALAAWSAAPGPALAPGDTLVRVVQPNTPQETRGDPDFPERSLRLLSMLSGAPGPVPRLIVWPEGAVDHFLEDGYPSRWYWRGDGRANRARLAALLGPGDMLLAGGSALVFDTAGTLVNAGNTIFAIDPAARVAGRYDKAHLVPYGEYLPWRPLLSRIGLARLVPGDIDFIEGPGPRTLTVPGFGAVGMQICYEIIFSGQVIDPRHRPALLFNPSNDAWFGAWGPPQHLAQARMRAIEEGVPILRSTPTGISAVIDADGRLVGAVPMATAGAIELPIPRPHAPTLFARVGNLMALVAVAVLLALAIAIRRRAR